MRRELAILLFAMSCAKTASAQPDNAAVAESLFDEGRRLMDEGKMEQACAKLDESQRLDPALGTLLNLALCHQKLGKTATAWAEYREAISLAVRTNDPRLDYAKARAAELQQALPHLTVVVAVRDGLRVSLDGVELTPAAWATPIPIDPGRHELVASAPGYERFEKSFRIAGEKSTRIEIPELVPIAPSSAAAAAAEPRVVPLPRPPEDSHASTRTAGHIVGGIGVLALGAGTYFGVRALSKKSDSDAECPTDQTCTERGKTLNDDAKTAARLSDVGIGLGLIGLGIGAYLVISSPTSRAPERARLELQPSVVPGGGGGSLVGRF
jgi:tetratricopeptide (TPR) repeat protein